MLPNFCRPAAEMLQNCRRLAADHEGTLSREVSKSHLNMKDERCKMAKKMIEELEDDEL